MTMERYRAARLLHPGHEWHGRPVDITVENGQISSLVLSDSGDWQENDKNLTGCWLSSGWWDSQVDFRDPGTERAEGLASGLLAAAQGGFTRVAPVASTIPCCDQPSDVLALLHRASLSVCGILPVAALSMERAGLKLSEAYALMNAGARAFSDDSPIQRPELLRRALEYHQPLGLPVFSDAHDPEFQSEGVMHEGEMSTALGLPGNSGESERLRIDRDLDILRYSGGRIHFPIVTTEAGLSAVHAAKQEGLKVTCGTTVHHLCWTDADLDGFNAAMKVMPPLRSMSDREALRQGALDGTLDVVVSDHRPRTPEEHDVDFMMVKPGMAGVHAAGPALLGALIDHGASEDEAMHALYRLFISGPRSLLGTEQERVPLAEGQPAEFTVFSLEGFSLPHSASKAPNTAFHPDTVQGKGRVVGTVTPRGSHWN